MCNAGDASEFLAAAQSWLELFTAAQDAARTADELWNVARAAHRAGLASFKDANWRLDICNRLQDSLFKLPRYAKLWGELSSQLQTRLALH